MHVVIINGSPRVQKYSNTDKIIAVFAKGLSEKGNTFETYAISNRKTWDIIRDAYIKNDEILIALPLYVECVPGLLLEFLEEKQARNRRFPKKTALRLWNIPEKAKPQRSFLFMKRL